MPVNEKGVSLKEVINKLTEWFRFLCKKWLIIGVVSATGAGLGVLNAFITDPVYDATISFVLSSNSNSSGSLMGLANQFGIDAAVAVVLIKQKPLILINPKIEKFSEVRFMHKEGCLSFPNEVLDVYRHLWVEVSSSNHKENIFFGVRVEENNSEAILDSAVVQHEIAHLNGLTFHDFQWKTSPTPKEW